MRIFFVIGVVSSIFITPLSGPETGGTLIQITGALFVPSTNLSCEFSSGVSKATFYNASHIECISPAGSNSTNLTVSGTNSFVFEEFSYYKPLSIVELGPVNGSDLDYHTLYFVPSEALGSDEWSLRIFKYTVRCSSNFSCVIPPLSVLQNLEPTNSTVFSIYLSRNSQQFEDTGISFQYFVSSFDQINLFDIFPRHGPKEGNTSVNISLPQASEIITPLCKFSNTIIHGFNTSSTGFFCLSPAGQGKVKVTISINGEDFSQSGKEFVYDNLTIYSYYPDQGSITGGTSILIHGDFMPYPQISCKFGSTLTTGSLSINEYLTCPSPSSPQGSVSLSISYNQQDFYILGQYYYRPIESITSLSPVSGPNSGGTLITFTMAYLNNTNNAYCRIGSTYKTKMFSNYTCMVPAVTIVSSPVKVYVSSNDLDYESYVTYTYYTRSLLTTITPAFVPDTLLNRTYNITGTGFLNTGVIKVSMQGILYTGTFLSSTLISFSVADKLSVGRLNVSVAMNGQNYSPSQVSLEVYKEPVLTSVNPNFGFIKGGIKLTLIGLDFVYSETIFCRFDSTDTQGTWVSESIVTCLNPTQSATKTVQVSVTFNNKLNFTNALSFEYISSPTLPSLSTTKSYIQEKLELSLAYSPSRPPQLVKVGLVWVQAQTLSSSSFMIKMPTQGASTVSFNFTYNYLEFQSGLSFTYISECVTGSYCPIQATYTQYACPPGYYCPGTSTKVPIACQPGTYAGSNSSACTSCPVGSYCPLISLSYTVPCADGFMCSSTGTAYEGTSCETGSYCKNNVKHACSYGKWCGLRTGFGSQVRIGDFRVAQPCMNGTYCAGGDTSKYGVLCTAGYYCVFGQRISCVTSADCPEGSRVPTSCLPGFYSSTAGKDACAPCAQGYMCPGDGNSYPTICPAGYVCSIKGRPSPYNVCPGGNYCLEGVDTETPGPSPGPVPCSSGSYCLMGVISGEINDGNVKYAQTCIQGTYCEPGESSPEAKACTIGHYCPPGSGEPVETEPGYYSQGLGNALPQPCPAGNYSNTNAATSCDPCPAGYYCPYDQMIVPIICPAGRYKELVSSSIYCELCPEGTYSVTPGLTSVDQCIPCDASIVCLSRGLNNLTQTSICPEGYVCSAGTTSSSLEKSPCPGGFWCPTKTSKPADYGICDPGFYCPTATGISSQHQFVCLEGFYCPPGTFAELNSDGQYLFINSSDYEYVIEAKIEYNKNCTGTCEPKEVPVFEICEEDVRLSKALRDAYTSLECPKGTKSSGGAVCVGQCFPHGELTTLINPVSLYTRFALDSNYTVVLEPFSISVFTFDFSALDPNLYYNTDFSLQIWGPESNQLPLPDYFSSDSFFHLTFNLTVINTGSSELNITPTIALHNDLFIPIIPDLENTLNVTVVVPNRATFGSQKLFAALVWDGSYGTIDMPFNLISLTKNDGSAIDPWLLDTGANAEWNGTRYDSPPFDSTFWINFGINSVALPWLPFFMNCEHFGDRIYVHRLTESMGNCTFVDPSQVKVVKPLPVSGVTPVADSCKVSVKCYYAEDVQPGSTTRWFEINQQETLYYMTRDAIDSSKFEATMQGQDSGFTQHIKDQDDYVVLVKFSPEGGSGIPTVVTMDLSYYQKDANTKLLVSAEVKLSAYSPNELNSENPGYTLNINYQALGWFDLLNKFQFEISIYLLLFIFISFILLLFGYFVYKVHLCCVRDNPVLHFRFYLYVSSLPPTVGVCCASIPIFLVAYSLDPITLAFTGISGDWAVEPPLDPDTVTAYQRGRVGMCMGFVAFCFFVYGSRLLIPKPDPPEEEEEEEEGAEQEEAVGEEEAKNEENPPKDEKDEENQEENTDARFEESETSKRNQEEEEEYNRASQESPAPESEPEEEPEELPIWDALKMKRRYFMIACLGISCLASIKLEISYTKMFSDNIFMFQVGFCALDVFLYQLFSRIVLDEALLVVPILTSLFINRSILMLASPNFTIFMECFVINFGFIIFERIYLNPFIELVEQKLQYLSAILVTKSRVFRYFFGNAVKEQLLLEKSLLSKNMKGKFESGETFNRMMGTMLQFSAQSQATFMLPLVYLFISNFSEASQIPKNYGIRKSDVNYYVLFSATIIISQLILDVLMLHLIECLYGYKLFDYLTYCSHRFSTRSTWWKFMVGVKLDKSLMPVWRSIDSLCFSSQYYFSVTLASWGIVLLTFSFTIMIRNAFHPCGDPMIWVYLFIIRYGGFTIKRFFLFIRPYVRLWIPKSHPIFIEEVAENDSEDQIVPLIEDYAVENELVEKMKSDLFRIKFLNKNIPFLIENLESIVDNNQYCHNFLKSRYKQLFDKHMVDEKERNYVDHRLDLLKLLPNNKFNPEFEVSFERELEPANKCGELSVVSTKIMRKWVSEAKLRILLKKTVEDHRVLGEFCSICNMTEHLKIVSKIPFDSILLKYKEDYKGYPLSLNHFKNYFFRKQEIRTLCIDCAYLEQLKQKNDPRAFSDLTKIAYEELQLYKPKHNKISPATQEIARKWLSAARQKLDQEESRKELFTIESVSEFELSAVVSQLEEPIDPDDI